VEDDYVCRFVADQDYWYLYYPQMSELNRYMQIRIYPRKRKLENDQAKLESYCTRLGYQLEEYSDHKDPKTYSLLHSDDLKMCFKCEHNSFDCEGHTLLYAHVPPHNTNLRLKIWPVDLESFRQQNMFMAFRFETSTGNPALLNEIFWIRLLLIVGSIALLHFRVRQLPFSDSNQRNELISLTGRQLFLQVLMNDPFWILVFTSPRLFRYTTLT
jgi:hypothetical protein